MTPEEVVRRFWTAQQAGDAATARATLADDLTWQVVGRTHHCARVYHGPDGFFGELIALLGRSFVPGSVTLELTHVTACGTTVVSEVHETAQGRNGHAFEVDLITVMEVEDGRITTCREYMDLAEVARAMPAESS